MQLCNINSLAITHTHKHAGLESHCSTPRMLLVYRRKHLRAFLFCSFAHLSNIVSYILFPPDGHDASPNVFLFDAEKHGGNTSVCVCVCVLRQYRKVVVLLHYVLRYHYIIALAWGGCRPRTCEVSAEFRLDNRV